MEDEKIYWHLKTYPLIIIMILGVLGNGMIFYIFFRKNFKTSSITKYMRILVVADTIVLCSGLLSNIYEGFNSNSSITQNSVAGCTSHRFIMFYSGDVAIWILVVITIDRLVAVVYPLQNSRWKSPKNTLFVLAFIFCLSFLKNFPILFTFTNSNKSRCEPRGFMVLYETKIRPAISLLLYYLIPVITLTVCTLVIVRKMNKMVGRMEGARKMSVASLSENRSHYSRSLTKMSFAINILFFILLTPSITIWTLLAYGIAAKEMRLLYDITNLLVFSHHALNFYLFFLTGPRFRREVLSIFGKKYTNVDDSRDNSHKTNKHHPNCAESSFN